jgi:hypothetical protein
MIYKALLSVPEVIILPPESAAFDIDLPAICCFFYAVANLTAIFRTSICALLVIRNTRFHTRIMDVLRG